MNHRRILFLLLFFASSVNLFSQGTGNKYAGEFLAIGVGGRPLGMGGAYVSLVNDVTAGYWNPGALAMINYPQFSIFLLETSVIIIFIILHQKFLFTSYQKQVLK